ncbi:MAG: COX15/CtaA family protein [Bacteroidia bacterium]
MATAKIVNRYRKTAVLTVVAVVFLIFVGGLVRMTGSGMGCPDWPKCFGQWIPPTDITQLPVDYKTRFQVAGKLIADFDPFKTWVEYINRLIGILIGFFAILTVAASGPLRREQKKVFQLSVAGLLAIIFQGLVGAYVVRTHLQVGTITVHMLIAIAIMGIYITALLNSYRNEILDQQTDVPQVPGILVYTGLAVIVLTLGQILLGTQVRENVDIVAEQMGEENRMGWIAALGGVYQVHRVFYYALAISLGFWLYRLQPWIRKPGLIQRLSLGATGVLIASIMLGLGMHHLGIPKIFQPLHLLFATVLIGIEFGLLGVLFLLNRESKQ